MKPQCAIAVLLFSIQGMLGQIVPNPVDPFESVGWGMTLREASQRTLPDSPPILTRDKKTGVENEDNGHVFFRRTEQAFGISVSASYAFSVKDSVLEYILLTTIESGRHERSSKGTIDTLWHRIARRYGKSKESRELGVVTRREWQLGDTYIVCFRSDQTMKSIVLSLARRKKE